MLRLVRFLFVVIMFSAGTRAFTSRVVAQTPATWKKSAFVLARGMSTTSGDDADTSIVSICQEKIQKALETKDVIVTGAYDDPNGSHISIQVVSPMFEGKRAVQRQQIVYKAIWEELQGPVHAVDSMVCKTPEEV
jgi:stress-induced morphogen